MPGELWRRTWGMGLESMYGTAVAASRQVYVMNDNLTREQPGRPKRFATGTRDNQRAHTLGPITAGGSAAMDVSGSAMLEFLAMTFGAATITTPAGATNARLHTYKPSNNTPQSATIERHDGAQIMRGTGYMVNSMTIAGNANAENTATFDLFGSSYGPWAGPLTTLTQYTPEFLEGWQTRLWLSAFGATAPAVWVRDALIAWTLTVANGLSRKYFARNSQDTAALNTGELEITAALTLEGVSATAQAEYTNWINQTKRQVWLEFIGPNAGVEAGASEVHTLTSTATGGTFTITILGLGPTGNIAFNASNATIQAALDALLGSGQVTVGGGPINTTPVTLTFGGQVGQWHVPATTIDNTSATGGTVVPTTSTPGRSGAEYVQIAIPGAWGADNLSGESDGTRSYELSLNYVRDSALDSTGAGIVVAAQSARTAAW